MSRDPNGPFSDKPFSVPVEGSPRQNPAEEFSIVDSHEEPRRPVIFDPHFKFPDPVKPPTRKFFNNSGAPWWAWPDPIDNILVRLTSFFILLCALTIISVSRLHCEEIHNKLDQLSCKKKVWWMLFLMWGDFTLRTIFGPTPFSPFGLLATGILYLLRVPPNLVPSPAKRFSFFLGIVINTVMIILWWGVATKDTREFAGRPLIVLCVFAGLESIGGFCVGCWFFGTFFRLKDYWQTRRDYKKLGVQDNAAKKWFNPTIDGSNDPHSYDVDLIVIGAGSGGLACAKEAARLNKKVVLLDYVAQTPHGTRWGVGGTCVNVGCIPKKLFHQAGIIGHYLKHDGFYYGWRLQGRESYPKPSDFHHDWELCRKHVQEHIKSLNDGYIKGFQEGAVQYINARGSFVNEHTIRAQLDDGSSQQITARRVVIAVGGHPKFDKSVEGANLAITSDDLFALEKSPGRTLVIGASYIALECAGFLSALGLEAVVMARSIFLRGFDRDMADRILDNMKKEGTLFMVGFIPTRYQKEGDKIRVYYRSTKKGEEDQTFSDVFDTVLNAIGREPNTANLGLDKTGVVLAPNKKIFHYNERTTVDHIYVIGDVAEPSIELTPVAIKQGLLLAQRLYNNSTTTFDFNFFPTTVFTPLEYGTIGVSEEKAIEVFGKDNIEVYHSEFTPLEYYVPRTKYTCYCKLIVNYVDHERVIGFHYLGPNAGEVTQGFASAFRAGLRKKDFDKVLGIHPTAAEEMVTLRRSKSSGLDPKKSGC